MQSLITLTIQELLFKCNISVMCGAQVLIDAVAFGFTQTINMKDNVHNHALKHIL